MSAISDRLSAGTLSARQLLESLKISAPTLSRQMQHDPGNVIRIGLGRSTRYGLLEPWSGLHAARFPLVRIDEAGGFAAAGELVTMAARQTAWLPDGEVFEGLPIGISDVSPAGYLGELFALANAGIGLPARASDWSDHHILLAATRRGEDLPGNLIVGQESFERWFGTRPEAATADDFPELAGAVLEGHQSGSPVPGKRPKFATFAEGRHVLVKFAGEAGAERSAAQRWSDLLALEALALDVLREHGIPAAHAQLLSSDTFRFLEIERFDRIGERGRRAVLTLSAVHRNPLDSWSGAGARLAETRRISPEDARRLRLLDAFGALIANTDRHHRNVLFFPAASTASTARYELAPAFDQLPMFYAPGPDGVVPTHDFVPPSPSADALDVWDEARAIALAFWRHGSDAPAVSPDMHRIAAANARALNGG